MSTGTLKQPSAAKVAEEKRLSSFRRAGAAAVFCALAVITYMVTGKYDPLAGPRPEVADVARMPIVIAAYKTYKAKNGRPPTPQKLTALLSKNRSGSRAIHVVSATSKAPHAFRLAGTAKEPRLELLDERGEIAVYGNSPLIIPMEAP